MPSFVCDGCQDVFKKPKIEAHLYRCPYATSISCVDCYQVWSDDGFRTHTQCVSEEQKTRGPYYKPPKAKKKQAKKTASTATAPEEKSAKSPQPSRSPREEKKKKQSKRVKKKQDKRKRHENVNETEKEDVQDEFASNQHKRVRQAEPVLPSAFFDEIISEVLEENLIQPGTKTRLSAMRDATMDKLVQKVRADLETRLGTFLDESDRYTVRKRRIHRLH
mmetsp:Transcript_49576/g.124643  ORF Transcript_49576/g.124643 Transcript_49576/m.124643 type:complete len:220 (+) Transcript_49576:142-801(+)|eukprot:CAMPEP_0174241712 /NCGR_PEP_ID=MMETSP0417-20130205/24528_1 /TAXON_ID=242541 /ORGANISM="Mayorella sp, Strain BSH-02190019" /LENGTH=219 /DNA_ID=CAMNT_0015320995 /DNA_START=76 /DNA_END=735 /DNA_ORIENTATION=+